MNDDARLDEIEGGVNSAGLNTSQWERELLAIARRMQARAREAETQANLHYRHEHGFADNLRTAEARIAELAAVLRIVEWAGMAPRPEGGRCPCCGSIRPKHDEKCLLAAALSGTAESAARFVREKRIEGARTLYDFLHGDSALKLEVNGPSRDKESAEAVDARWPVPSPKESET